MLCQLDGTPVEPEARPSAETPLHSALYSLDENIGAVLHTHSVNATLLSMQSGEVLGVTGFEMQKAGLRSLRATTLPAASRHWRTDYA